MIASQEAIAAALPPSRVRLPVLLGLCFVLSVLWTAITFHLGQRQSDAIAQGLRDAANLSIAVREDVERTLAGVDQILRFVAADHRADPAGFDFAAWVDRSDSLRDVAIQFGITDPRGRFVQSSQALPSPIVVSDRAYFRHHRDHPEAGAFVGPVTSARLSGSAIFHLSRRLERPDGGFAGVVFASIESGWMADRFAALDVGRQGSVALVGQDGLLRARSPAVPHMFERSLRGTAAGDLLFSYLDAGREGTMRVHSTVDGADRTYGYRALRSLPLFVVVGKSVPELLAPVEAERWRVLGLGGGATLAIVGLFVWLLREERLRRHGEAALAVAHRDVAAAEREARRSNGFLLAAEKVAQSGHWRVELDGMRLSWSPEIFRIYGLLPSADPPTVEQAIAAYHPDDRAKVASCVEDAIRHGRAFDFRARIVRPSGEVREVVSRGRVEREPNGAIVAIFGAILDVTALRQVRVALAASEERYRLLTETTGDVIVKLGLDFRRQSVSTACRELLGYEPEELLGQVPFDAMHPDDAPAVRNFAETLVAGTFAGDKVVITLRTRHREGHWIWVQARMALARNPDGAPDYIMASLRDVSEGREAPALPDRPRPRLLPPADPAGKQVA